MCTKLPEMKCSSELIFKSSNAREKKLYKRKFPSMHKTLKCSLMKHLTDKQTREICGKYHCTKNSLLGFLKLSHYLCFGEHKPSKLNWHLNELLLRNFGAHNES